MTIIVHISTPFESPPFLFFGLSWHGPTNSKKNAKRLDQHCSFFKTTTTVSSRDIPSKTEKSSFYSYSLASFNLFLGQRFSISLLHKSHSRPALSSSAFMKPLAPPRCDGSSFVIITIARTTRLCLLFGCPWSGMRRGRWAIRLFVAVEMDSKMTPHWPPLKSRLL